jgi:hypothetical protein
LEDFGKIMRENTIFKQNGGVLREICKVPLELLPILGRIHRNFGRIGYRALALKNNEAIF